MCLHRDKSTRDFSLSDLSVIHLLYPHLVNCFRWYHTVQKPRCTSPAVIKEADLFSLLTPREWDITRLVLAGADNNRISSSLGLSVNTVKMHLKNIYSKFGVRSRAQLISLYLKLKGN